MASMDTPPLTLVDHRDIRVFQGHPYFYPVPLYCSSLEGKRTINDVFDILDIAVQVGSSNAFALREIRDGVFLPTVYERGATGTLKPGSYVIMPQEGGARVLRTPVMTFEAFEEEPRPKKKANVSDKGTVETAVSKRDGGPRGFTMRLVYRDEGCVVCHAEEKVSIYKYRDDSEFFQSSYIFPFAMQTAWSRRGYQELIADPYTETRVENATRNKRDPLRINSLENGILLCLFHHKAYETFRFSIHPITHKIVVFHPVVACLQGLEVTSPWKDSNPKYPSPHNDLLEAHFQTSIFTSLSRTTMTMTMTMTKTTTNRNFRRFHPATTMTWSGFGPAIRRQSEGSTMKRGTSLVQGR